MTNAENDQQAHLWDEPVPKKTTRKRPKDELWDVLTEHFGEVRTKTERGRRNRAARELREAGATAEEVQTVLEYCERNFTTFTEVACCGWLARALREKQEEETPSNVLDLFRKAQRR
jgi:hypothetical protein